MRWRGLTGASHGSLMPQRLRQRTRRSCLRPLSSSFTGDSSRRTRLPSISSRPLFAPSLSPSSCSSRSGSRLSRRNQASGQAKPTPALATLPCSCRSPSSLSLGTLERTASPTTPSPTGSSSLRATTWRATSTHASYPRPLNSRASIFRSSSTSCLTAD